MDCGRLGTRMAVLTATALLSSLGLLLGDCGPHQAKTRTPDRVALADSAVSPAAAQHALTGFPLIGHHANLPCDACHGESQPRPECGTCHKSPHGNGLDKVCEDCHTPGLAFEDVRFKHAAEGLFAFHADVACIKCHEGARFGRASRNCAGCHADFHKGALGRDCYECHRGTIWSITSFNHSSTGFPLMGAHSGLECGDCHRDLQSFRIVPRPTGCASCHEKDYRRSPFQHAAYGAGTDCQECHLQDSWSYAHSPAWFNVQTGTHAGIGCTACHKNSGDYREYTCHDCHRAHSDDNGGRCLDCHTGGFGGGGEGD
jgi:hypothetical protein